jgi:WD40 repeat protein
MGSRFAKSCLVTADGKYAITEARTTLFVWNLQQHEKIQFIEHHCRTLPQQSCLLSPDDSYFVAVNEGTIAFYKFGEPEPFRTMPGLAPMALSPDGEAFLYRDPDKDQLRIDSLASTSKEALWLEGDNNSQTCKFSHGGDLVAACTDDGALTVWEAATGKQRFRVLAHQEYAQDPSTFSDIHASWNPTMNCAFTFDDQLILTIGIDQFMKAWDAETGELVTAFPMFSKGASFDVDHTQPIAILGDYGGSVFLVDIIQP